MRVIKDEGPRLGHVWQKTRLCVQNQDDVEECLAYCRAHPEPVIIVVVPPENFTQGVSLAPLAGIKTVRGLYSQTSGACSDPECISRMDLETLNLQGAGVALDLSDQSSLRSLHIDAESLGTLPARADSLDHLWLVDFDEEAAQALNLDGFLNLSSLVIEKFRSTRIPTLAPHARLQSLLVVQSPKVVRVDPAGSRVSKVELMGCRGIRNLGFLQSFVGMERLFLNRCGHVEGLPSGSSLSGLVALSLEGGTRLVDRDFSNLPESCEVFLRGSKDFYGDALREVNLGALPPRW